MTKTKINAQIIADSIDPRGNRITTILGVIPRIILAELNTHRMFSRNSASSRAIPFKRMVEAVKDDPFIPIAWQKNHSGMQGTEYWTENEQYQYPTIEGINGIETNKGVWLQAASLAVSQAEYLNNSGKGNVTKQLCNRLLEPFMWHTVLITSTEWENFFQLRCPQYVHGDKVFRSRKDWLKYNYHGADLESGKFYIIPTNDVEWLQINKSAAEIHIQAFAEAVWDAMNENTPKELKEGEWHIPYSDKFNIPEMGTEYGPFAGVKVSTAMCARTSYTTIGEEKEMTYAKLIEIHDKMANQVPFHASPFEHCARVMTEEEYYSHVKGTIKLHNISGSVASDKSMYGWCRNFRGFIQYRHILETKNN